MKLQKQSIRKIDISQINITDNIRKQYDDIEQLARSIERDGQLQPIGVSEQEDGTFNMLYGFRRLNAFLFLLDEGKDFNQIEAKITTGDPAIIQLIENIHRDDLKPEEFENALQALVDAGMKQKEIADRLNIRVTRISDTLVAKKIRDSMKEKRIDTTGMSTSAISLIRSVPEEKQKEAVKKIKKKGGTVKAVREVTKEIIIEKHQNVGPIVIPTNMNPEYCTRLELCENQTKCNICSYDSRNVKTATVETEESSIIQMSIKDFLHLPEVKAIIYEKKIFLQDKCEYCGKDF